MRRARLLDGIDGDRRHSHGPGEVAMSAEAPAAWQDPDIVSNEPRAAFRTLR
jgi:hypothetical protein